MGGVVELVCPLFSIATAIAVDVVVGVVQHHVHFLQLLLVSIKLDQQHTQPNTALQSSRTGLASLGWAEVMQKYMR